MSILHSSLFVKDKIWSHCIPFHPGTLICVNKKHKVLLYPSGHLLICVNKKTIMTPSSQT